MGFFYRNAQIASGQSESEVISLPVGSELSGIKIPLGFDGTFITFEVGFDRDDPDFAPLYDGAGQKVSLQVLPERVIGLPENLVCFCLLAHFRLRSAGAADATVVQSAARTLQLLCRG